MPAPFRLLVRSFLPASALLAILLPTALALFLARSASMQRQREIAATMAQHVLARTDAIRADMLKAQAALAGLKGEVPCSPEGIALMRVALLHTDTLADVGYVRDDRLLCSAFGMHDLSVGPPAYFSAEHYDIRTGLHLKGASDINLIAATYPETGITMFVHDALAVDGIPADEPWRAAVVGHGHGSTVLVKRGGFDPDWLRNASGGSGGTFVHKQFIVAWGNSRAGGAYTAFAAMPASMWQPAMHKSTLLALALGLPTSILLALVLRRVANRNTTIRYLLRQALKRGELTLAYQPIVELAGGRWVGAEALMRWQRPNGEVVSPDVFIPIAEKSGLMPAVSEYLIHMFERETHALFGQYPAFHVALNFSAEDFCAGDFPARLQLAIERTGAKPHNLHVEVTERVFAHMEDFHDAVDRLRKLGVAIAIDDFGTGYSSLSYLTQLKFDYLKIDRSFVNTIGTGAVTSAVVDHIIAMAQSLGISMVAEGVETRAQADYLREHGVQYAQGWLYARAIPVARLLEQLSPSIDGRLVSQRPVVSQRFRHGSDR